MPLDISGQGNAAVGGVMDLAFGGIKNKRNEATSNRLADRQQERDIDMTLLNYDLAMKKWEDTGYGAQRKQLEDAGLNVGLMYGMGGAGGQSSQIQTASKGAPNVGDPNGSAGMAMGLQMGMQKAQIDNLNASTNKMNVDANKTATVDTANTTASTEKLQKEAIQLAAQTGLTIEQAKKVIEEQAKTKAETTNIEANTVKQASETKNIEANTTRTETMTPLERDLKKQEIKREVTKNVYLDQKERAELDLLVQDLLNKKAQVEQGQQKLDIEQFINEMKADYPSLMDVTGRSLDGIIRGILQLGGNDSESLKRHVKPTR